VGRACCCSVIGERALLKALLRTMGDMRTWVQDAGGGAFPAAV
jgi:hypothetical protein